MAAHAPVRATLHNHTTDSSPTQPHPAHDHATHPWRPYFWRDLMAASRMKIMVHTLLRCARLASMMAGVP